MSKFSFNDWRAFLKDRALSYYSPDVDPYLLVAFADSDLSKYLYSLAIKGEDRWSSEDIKLLATFYSKKQSHSFANQKVLDHCIESFSNSIYNNVKSEFRWTILSKWTYMRHQNYSGDEQFILRKWLKCRHLPERPLLPKSTSRKPLRTCLFM